ncbi:nucleotidyltransferase family protein [Brachybacterium sp. AOP43-C2-M15]|uniref:nucleotidyltransferase family protein n=1 Tax=Brachybacterium sp. AOP43-C2-M15 TaxID=3457661 RepID=UPI0040333687
MSRDLLDRLLAAADYRPSLALAARREEPIDLAARHGLGALRVFGSVARGAYHHASDIDLLVNVDPAADPLRYSMFVAEATEMLGFPFDVVVDTADLAPRIRRFAVPL